MSVLFGTTVSNMGFVTHIVAFAYDQAASNAEKHLIASSFVALKDSCQIQRAQGGEQRGETYIVDITGGAQNSPEAGPGQDYEVRSMASGQRWCCPSSNWKWSFATQHCFVLTFLNKEDRDYYLDNDPAHQKFKKSLQGKISKVFVFDFEVGRFE